MIFAELPSLYMGYISSSLAFLIIGALEISTADCFLKRYFFENPLLRFLGRISYGMYLWHLPLAKICEIHGYFYSNAYAKTLLVLTCTILVSFLMQKCVEEMVRKKCNDCQMFGKPFKLGIFIILTSCQFLTLSSVLDTAYEQSPDVSIDQIGNN